MNFCFVSSIADKAGDHALAAFLGTKYEICVILASQPPSGGEYLLLSLFSPELAALQISSQFATKSAGFLKPGLVWSLESAFYLHFAVEWILLWWLVLFT